MITTKSLHDLNITTPTLLTLGSFDGLHLGHQHLIGSMVAAAHTQNAKAAVLTFYPNPAVVLRGYQPAFYIHTREEKTALLAGMGVDILVMHPFNQQVAQITAADFLQQMYDALHMREIWAGKDFAIGHKRQGNLDWLLDQRSRYGFTIHTAEPVTLDGERISSSRVRHVLHQGDVTQAARLLGRPLRIPGTVIHGDHRGQSIGFPTANLSIWNERVYPALGVYACWAWLPDDPTPRKAAVNIGIRPTFDGASQRVHLEAHLLDFSGDLYGQTLALDFIARLRPETKFQGIDALIAQIEKDIAQTIETLDTAPIPN